ncbi:protein kinase domain-containing protein [Acinetobacter sp. CFCC 10889]|uniref:protein kinase domain-containing protein n=1 Tax=Acinetobacter sp. CFCC 10889 TaxID=1775557 RepID=UPI000DCFC0AF|nr:protein kinase [Acinetobacter sp. CFCC 10889]
MNLVQLRVAQNSARSQAFGRRVYCVEHGARKTWIKLQLTHVNAEYERGFLNELEIYGKLNYLETPDEPILCNFSISDINDQYQKSNNLENIELYLNRDLCVEHAEALFLKSPFELSFAEVLIILHKSLDVLHNLHQLEFIHGDLKVEHFRLTDFGAALIDFEQSCHLDDVRQMPNTATPRYMAPELFHAQPKSLQSDLYALGIIWLEWLTQEKLQAKSYQDWAYLHCQNLKISLIKPFQVFEEVLELMLSKKITQRCTNIYQIKQVLSQIG